MENTHSDALVFFGASGDLAFKQIFPALQAMARRGDLNIPVIGVAKSGWNLERLIARARESVEARGGFDAEAFGKMVAHLQYIDGDYKEEATYAAIRAALGSATHPLHYLAIPPSLFGTVAEGLAKSGSASDARIVVEKPFGRDLASAHGLNEMLHKFFPESAIFRIDHYLGKEAVQNLLYFRFANSFMEPIWNRTYIDNMQITMAENFGVEGRGRLYEEMGALRDVVQNHMLQVIALLTMDAPVNNSPEVLRDEKIRIFRAMRPLTSNDLVRGQFRGYTEEEGVASDSEVETFAALRLHIDSWRWSGVPFFVRTGKELPVTATEVLVQLKRPPQAIFDKVQQVGANNFRFQLSPDVFISVGARAKMAGDSMVGEGVELIARHQSRKEKSPYERLLGDAIKGDASLFARQDSVEAAWRIVDPVLRDQLPPYLYPPDTWGPAEADGIISCEGGWHNPVRLPPSQT
ncbi:MAG TPA: glucose-6-phosphate dehydrogenase [Bryobacteraceae bacterium]|nr:glucose-6-phosphate dehydrogenase [Bryobacteraceae bacterium]